MNLIEKIDLTDKDIFVKHSFEIFVTQQPHIKVIGLYKESLENYNKYYILCENISENTLSTDGRDIREWLSGNQKMGEWISLTTNLPENTTKLEERKLTDLVEGRGTYRSWENLQNDLYLLFPKNLSDFIIKRGEKQREINIIFSKNPFKNQLKKIKDVLNSLEYPTIYNIYVDESLNINNYFDEEKKKKEELLKKVPLLSGFIQDTLQVPISKRNKGKLPKELLNLLEEDEDFWLSKRNKIFSNQISEVDDILKPGWNKKISRCFINVTSAPTNNIRNYLTIFEQIIIAPPSTGNNIEVLKSLGLTYDELTELCKLEKVKFLLPQPITNYTSTGIEDIAGEFPDSFILSRRLAASTILDTRKRFPLFYPPFGIHERREFLYSLKESNNKIEKNSGNFLNSILEELGKSWLSAEDLINRRGAFATSALGIGTIISSMIKSSYKKDLYLEFIFAASNIDWAAPFNSTVVPVNYGKEYSEDGFIEIISNFYSGIFDQSISTFFNKHNLVLEGILSINEDVDVIDLAKSFSNSDIQRLRNLIYGLVENNKSIEDYNQIIKKFNKEVKQYEKSVKRLSQLDIKGFLRGAATITSPISAVLKLDPHVTLATGSIALILWLHTIASVNRDKYENISKILDYIDASVHRKSKPNAILVSRINKKTRFVVSI